MSMEFEGFAATLEGAGDGGLDVLSVLTAIFALIVFVLFPEVELLLLLLAFWARSLAHAARWARQASSRVWPTYFPPGEMQKSAV